MNALKAALIAGTICITLVSGADAKGGFSSSAGSGSRGSFSSAPSRSYSPSYTAPRTTTTTTRTTNYSRSYGGGYGGGYGYGGGRYYGGGGYYHPYGMFGGFGMGHGAYGSNGLLEGIIIGNLMHPQGTTVYSGGGYNGQALLYPNGQVVDENGYQVGTYANGQFTQMQNGPMVAQPAPAVAQQQMQPPAPAPQPVIVEHRGPSAWDILCSVALVIFGGAAIIGAIWLIFALIRWMFTMPYWNDEEEIETVTTTTTTTTEEEPERTVHGDLKRKRDRATGQHYIFDPVDSSKMFVNDTDDMYEDAAGKVWRLI